MAKTRRQHLLNKFLGILLPLLFLVVCFVTLDRYHRSEQARISEHHLVLATQKALSSRLALLASDIKVLTRSLELNEFINQDDENSLHRLQQRFISFISATKRYDQVRLLNTVGQEQVRVNFNGLQATAVPEHQLQDKSRRPYFLESLSLLQNELYFSRFDLNVESDQVETPWKPMLRVSVKVYDHKNLFAGVVVLNFLGSILIDDISSYDELGEGAFFLINSDGDYLYGADENKNWAFMFGRDALFGQEYPKAWNTIKEQENGQVQLSDGIFTFGTVYFPSFVKSDEGPQQMRHLIVGSYLPYGILYGNQNGGLNALYIVIPFMVLIVAVLAWYWGNTSFRAEQHLKEVEQLSKVIEQSDELVVITDKKGDIEYVNPAFEHQTGYPADDIIGQNTRILNSGKQDESFYSSLWKTVLSGEPFNDIFINKRKNGTLFYEQKLISPIIDRNGEIIQFVSTGRDISELKKLENLHSVLHELAYHDALTGLPNRANLMGQLEQLMDSAERSGKILALLFIDLDGFKQVNDQYGHQTGDQLLQEVAARLKKKLRKLDLAGRLSGDEFLLIMQHFNHVEDVKQVVCELLDILSEPYDLEGRQVIVTASVGVALHPFDEIEAEDLLRYADHAMYQAKQAGKNRYAFYDAVNYEMNV